MSHLERLLKQAKNHDLWGAAENGERFVPKELLAVRRDAFDKAAWRQIVDQVPVLKRQITELMEKHPTSPDAYEDLFNILNQGDPRFRDPKEMRPDHLPQHALMQAFDAADDMKWVKEETRYDEYNTALAMIAMADRMEKAFDDMQDAIDKIKERMEQLAEAIRNGEIELQAGGNPQPGEGAAGALEQAMQGMAEAAGLTEALDEMMANAAAAAAHQARGEIEQEVEAASAFGVEQGQLQRMSFEEREALSKKLHQSRLMKFANMIGSWQMFADAERRRGVKGAPAEIRNIKLGGGIDNLVSSELVNLAVPELEDLFWLRYAKGELLKWEVKGVENAGKGPILVVCDESGSMSDRLDGEGNTREMWSKAVSLALNDAARRQGRDFTYIGFASEREMYEVSFPGGRADVDKVLEFTSHFFAGGTHYERPLTRAMEIVRDYEKRGKAKPDIVFITDADCRVGEGFVEQWHEMKKAADVRCYGIQIGGSGHHTDMQLLVDRCINIDRLNASPEGVRDLFRSI